MISSRGEEQLAKTASEIAEATGGQASTARPTCPTPPT